MTKHWSILIWYSKVLYYVNMNICYCPWHLRITHFQTFYYVHIIEIPTNKGANSHKLICFENNQYNQTLITRMSEHGLFVCICLKCHIRTHNIMCRLTSPGSNPLSGYGHIWFIKCVLFVHPLWSIYTT